VTHISIYLYLGPPQLQVWRGAPGNGSVVSGGVHVTGWAPTMLGGRAAFVAPVPAAAVAPGPSGVIRQLWVRGTREYAVLCLACAH
jgi:hypothetical protein